MVKTKCPVCGEELIYDQTLDTYNENKTTMIRKCFGSCSKCDRNFVWKERYQFVDAIEICEVEE